MWSELSTESCFLATFQHFPVYMDPHATDCNQDFIFALWFTLAGACWLLFLLLLLLSLVAAANGGNPTPVAPRTSFVYYHASVRLFLCWQPSWYLRLLLWCLVNASCHISQAGSEWCRARNRSAFTNGSVPTPATHLRLRNESNYSFLTWIHYSVKSYEVTFAKEGYWLMLREYFALISVTLVCRKKLMYWMETTNRLPVY